MYLFIFLVYLFTFRCYEMLIIMIKIKGAIKSALSEYVNSFSFLLLYVLGECLFFKHMVRWFQAEAQPRHDCDKSPNTHKTVNLEHPLVHTVQHI